MRGLASALFLDSLGRVCGVVPARANCAHRRGGPILSDKQQDRKPPRIASKFLCGTLRYGFPLTLVTVRVVIVVMVV